MPGPKPPEINLSQAAEAQLVALTRRHSTRQQIAKRARIILLAAMGKENVSIAQETEVNRNMVSQWRQRWVSMEPIPLAELSVEERLEDLPRPGAPARITAEQRCELEALACEAPEKSGRPISQWTNREIADELMKRNIVDTISPRHAGRLLKRIIDSSSHEPILVEHRKGCGIRSQERCDQRTLSTGT